MTTQHLENAIGGVTQSAAAHEKFQTFEKRIAAATNIHENDENKCKSSSHDEIGQGNTGCNVTHLGLDEETALLKEQKDSSFSTRINNKNNENNRTPKHSRERLSSMAEVFASLRLLDYSCFDHDTSFETDNVNELVEDTGTTTRAITAATRKAVTSNNNSNSNIDQNTTFWHDLTQMSPGSVPHSVVVGTTIGIVCGVLAYVYYMTLEWLLDFIWKSLPTYMLSSVDPAWHWIWIPIVGYTMAIGVGVSVKYLGEPGDLAYTVQCVHDKAYIGMDHVMPMLCSSQFSILGGGSLGPEAPLVAICASFGGYISRTIFRQTERNIIRKHTLMGMACALAAFFGVPLGGSIFALEINNRFGIEYYEHTIEAIFSGTVCLCVFRSLTGLDMSPIWDLSTSADGKGGDVVHLQVCDSHMVILGGLIGLMGAAVAGLFSMFHQQVVMPCFKSMGVLHNHTAIERALIGSTVFILIGVFIPQTLFWGESEFQVIATASPAANLPHVYPTAGIINFEMNNFTSALLVGIVKMIAISLTVAAGYRGGFIFPFFVAGAAFGRALCYAFPKLIPIPLATLCFAAGINVAITRTTMATTLILTALSGELKANPPILAASIVSLFVTSYMPFIRSQIKRNDIVRQSVLLSTGPRAKKERIALTDDSQNNNTTKINMYGSTSVTSLKTLR